MTDARDLTISLGGRWHGRYGAAPCPVCQPERRRDQNGLTLADASTGRLMLHCKKFGCGFTDILAAAGLRSSDCRGPYPAKMEQREAEREAEAVKKAEQARRVWQEALPIEATPAEAYLHARGIRLATLPPALRFHPHCWHVTAQRLPALVALVDGGEGFAIHRTYLRPDGAGKAAVEPPKAMLGATAGGAVRLTHRRGRLVVGEGIESTLAACMLRGESKAGAWAALSTSGLIALHLPPETGQLCIASDGDAPGMTAAHKLAHRASALGWAVTIAQPPTGSDWADVLRERATA